MMKNISRFVFTISSHPQFTFFEYLYQWRTYIKFEDGWPSLFNPFTSRPKCMPGSRDLGCNHSKFDGNFPHVWLRNSAQFWGESAWPIVVLEVQDTLTFHPCVAVGHAGFFFSGKISWAVPRFPPGTATAPVVQRDVLSDIEREREGGNEGLFLGHKSGPALIYMSSPLHNQTVS